MTNNRLAPNVAASFRFVENSEWKDGAVVPEPASNPFRMESAKASLASVSKSSPTVAELLTLTSLSDDRWEGIAQHSDPVRLYGGLSTAQAVVAGLSGIPAGWHPSSVKVNFGRAGDGRLPVTYRRQIYSHGRTRWVAAVVAQQGDTDLLWAIVEAHCPAEDSIYFQADAPHVPRPLQCAARRERLSGPTSLNYVFEQRFEDVEIRRVPQVASEPTASHWWMRIVSPLEGSAVNAAAVAYLADFVVLDAALAPHGLAFADPGIGSVSLDFSIWWHQPLVAYEWLLVEAKPVVSINTRSLAYAGIWNQAGNQVATVVQEGRLTFDRALESAAGGAGRAETT